MEMAKPPMVADLQTEVASGWIEKRGGLFDEDVMVTGMCFVIKTLL